MGTKQLTDRQRRVYELIRELILNRGYGPTVREIGEAFGIKSPNGVMCHLRALERKGLILRSPNKSRAIELTEKFARRNHSLPMAGLVADFVVIQKQETAEPGQMVVAELPSGDSTLKFWFPEEGRIRLQPANAEMSPLYVDDAKVVGVAVGVVRNVL